MPKTYSDLLMAGKTHIMSSSLSDRDAVVGRMLIDQAHALILSHEMHDGLHGHYGAGVFEAACQWDGESYYLEVVHLGVPVMLYRWNDASEHGKLSVRPGSWQTDFMSLRPHQA